MKYYIINFILAVLPTTRMFEFKRILLNLLGVKVSTGTRICGGTRFFGGGKVEIGAECWIGIGARFITSPNTVISIGDRCDIAPEVIFMCGSHEIGTHERRAGEGQSSSIAVGSGSWIGVSTTLLGGSQVGEGCIVGARSLLLPRPYDTDSLFVGSPAKFVRKLSEQ